MMNKRLPQQMCRFEEISDMRSFTIHELLLNNCHNSQSSNARFFVKGITIFRYLSYGSWIDALWRASQCVSHWSSQTYTLPWQFNCSFSSVIQHKVSCSAKGITMSINLLRALYTGEGHHHGALVTMHAHADTAVYWLYSSRCSNNNGNLSGFFYSQ